MYPFKHHRILHKMLLNNYKHFFHKQTTNYDREGLMKYSDFQIQRTVLNLKIQSSDHFPRQVSEIKQFNL